MSATAERSGPRPRRPVALVVDDDPLIRRMLGRLLEPLGCTVAFAATAAEARALAADRPRFLVAIVDLALPDGYGVDLIEELRDELGDRAPPFVILSGEPPDRRPDCVVAVLEKPLGMSRVVPIVRGTLEHLSSLSSSPGLPRPSQSVRARAAVAEELVAHDARDPRRER